MYGPPEEDGFPDIAASPKMHNSQQPNRGADHAPEVVESHGLEYNAAGAARSYPQAVSQPQQQQQQYTPLPEYTSYRGKDDYGGFSHHHHHQRPATKEGGGGMGFGGGLEPIDSRSHAMAVSTAPAKRNRVCGVSRLAFFSILSLLAVVLVAIGLGVGLGVGLQHSSHGGDGASSSAAASASSFSSYTVPSPTSTVTPSKSANSTCQAGIRYCGWDLIEQHPSVRGSGGLDGGGFCPARSDSDTGRRSSGRHRIIMPLVLGFIGDG
ncbi:hypothetical protein PG999_001817 [Apiospora kogelbergensis]|uniref:Uncharacterized protein n=1 Tax=Apiospora kogelbergensis TaxID=1337665 RepID=A0AAW0R6D5_9PEZI